MFIWVMCCVVKVRFFGVSFPKLVSYPSLGSPKLMLTLTIKFCEIFFFSPVPFCHRKLQWKRFITMWDYGVEINEIYIFVLNLKLGLKFGVLHI